MSDKHWKVGSTSSYVARNNALIKLFKLREYSILFKYCLNTNNIIIILLIIIILFNSIVVFA